MDPRQWNVGMDIEVNIGLGTGSRDRDMAILTNILNSQIADMDRLQASGFIDDAIDMVPKIIKTQIKIAEAAGIKSPETFYPEIPPERLEQMKQQAKELAAQGTPEQQAAQAKLQSDMQAKQLDLQLKEQQGQIDAQLQQQKTQADLQMKQMEIQANMQLERERMAQEAQMRQAQITAELNLKRELAMMGYGAQSASVGTVQVGGNPG
jgi:hypothetical protein